MMNQRRLDYYEGYITIKYKEKYVYQFFKRFIDLILSGLALILFGLYY